MTRGFAVALLAAAAAACSAAARSPEPVPVGRVECARCRMLVSTDRGGGQIVSDGEDTRFYDDVGCLAADWTTHDRRNASAYVRLGTGEWREASAASYARPAGIETPMASGLVAFGTPAEARAADRAGRALTFDDLVALAGEKK